jgi:hypothetical protein
MIGQINGVLVHYRSVMYEKPTCRELIGNPGPVGLGGVALARRCSERPRHNEEGLEAAEANGGNRLGQTPPLYDNLKPMRTLVLALLLAGIVSAQIVVSPLDVPAAQTSLAPHDEQTVLHCVVAPIKPALIFGFRFQAGYRLDIPLIQYSTGARSWSITVRITPEGGAPIYLTDHANVLLGTHPDGAAQIIGTYLLGDGHYHAELALSDESGRVCHKDWQIAVAKNLSERSIRVAMAPGRVADLSYRGDPTAAAPAGPPVPRGMTILLNCSTPYRAVGPEVSESWADYRLTLPEMLESLMEKLPGTTVRLVVFDLDRRSESLRQDGFTLQDMPKAVHAVADQEHDVVSVSDLQNQPDTWPFLGDLIRKEEQSPARSDTVLFLGARIDVSRERPAHFLDSERQGGLRFLYLQYWPDMTPPNFDQPRGCRVAKRGDPPCPTRQRQPNDAIADTVEQLKGKTMAVHWTTDFAKLVDAIKHR